MHGAIVEVEVLIALLSSDCFENQTVSAVEGLIAEPALRR